MKNFAEKIRSLISPAKGSEKELGPFEFVKSKKGILKELIISKELKNVIGVYCDVLGEGMFLTAVEDIQGSHRQEIIVFHQYDMNGRLLIRTSIELEKIQMVCPFNSAYKHPVLSGNRADKPHSNEYKTAASLLQ